MGSDFLMAEVIICAVALIAFIVVWIKLHDK